MPPHYLCPDCGKRCRCYFPTSLHEPCEKRRSVHLVVFQPVPKPEKSQRGKWPEGLYAYIHERDRGCVAHRVGLGRDRRCYGRLEIDHVRKAPGKGLKSPTEPWNLVVLCGQHHYDKTVHRGGDWRPALIKYLNDVEERNADDD